MARPPSFVDVAVDAPVGIDRTFTYSVPSGMDLSPGQLVWVPFNRLTVQGIVFSFATSSPVDYAFDVASVAWPEPFLDESRLRLARWVSRKYMCPLFEAAAPMLPVGARGKESEVVDLSPSDRQGSNGAELTEDDAALLSYLGSSAPLDRVALIRALGDGARRTLERLEVRGLVEITSVRPEARVRTEVCPLPENHTGG